MRSTSAMAASAQRRASVSASAQICSSFTEAIAEKPKWNRGIVDLILPCRRRKSERLADSCLDPSCRERLEPRAAIASETPIRSLAVEIELDVKAPAIGQSLDDRHAGRQCAECRQARVSRIG